MLEAQPATSVAEGSQFEVGEPAPKKRGILWVLIGVSLVLLMGIVAFFVWRYLFTKPQTITSINNNSIQDLNLIPAEPDVPVNVNSTLVNTPPTSPDRDRDGLTADEESAFGTSDAEPDSDRDGLNDREEVMIYKTNPLNPDTDSDSYLDGDEVKSLYNPNGPGKLFSLANLQP